MESYAYVLQAHICYMQSSKCSYVNLRKNFGNFFTTLGNFLVMSEIKFKMQYYNLS